MEALERNNQQQCQTDKTRSSSWDVCRRHSVMTILSQAEREVFDNNRAEWASAMTFGACGRAQLIDRGRLRRARLK